MSRVFVSRPVSLALEDHVIAVGRTVFDYGCGRGGDIRHLERLGYAASGWDPAFAPGSARSLADVVNLGYVVNVIEDPHERARVLRDAWGLARGVLVVAARLRWEEASTAGDTHSDGVITRNRTFQKFFTQEELRSWIDATLGVKSVAAAPGIFYVFRSPEDAQGYLARQARGSGVRPGLRIADVLFQRHRGLLEPLETFVKKNRRLPNPTELQEARTLVAEFGSVRAAFALVRRATGADQWRDIESGRPTRTSERRYEEHRELLEPLVEFISQRGRLPRGSELRNEEAIVGEFGSIAAAFSLIRRVTDEARWTAVQQRCSEDLLIYLALSAFGGRPRYSELPPDLQYDVRDLFGSHREACDRADKVLFAAGNSEVVDKACRNARVGKVTPEALYVHTSALGDLGPVLRVYDGCARALTGTVEAANLLKLHRLKAQVSYLTYPAFDTEPHPALATVVIGRLAKLDVTYRDFRASVNPPILHRKETFVSPAYPRRSTFARLTQQEERYGLLDDPVRIGTRQGWSDRLSEAQVALRGHRVVVRSGAAKGGRPRAMRSGPPVD